MAVYKLDHIGIAVVSIDDASGIYKDLGLVETHREEVPAQRCVAGFFPVGDTCLELLEPTSPDSPIGKFLARRGQGIHHLCFAVDDIEKALADLASRGYRLVNTEPVAGADGRRIAFLHPEAGSGVLIELAEGSSERE